MRRTISYILITVVALANILAPISVGKDFKLKNNFTGAETYYGENVNITVNPKKDGNLGININGIFVVNKEMDSATVSYSISKDPNPTNLMLQVVFYEKLDTSSRTTSNNVFTYSFGHQLYKYYDGDGSLKDVVKGETYYAMVLILTPEDSPVDVYLSKPVSFIAGTPASEGIPGGGQSEENASNAYDNTIASGGTKFEATNAALSAGVKNEKVDRYEDFMPVCSLDPWNFKLGGCIAQGVYYLFFIPTSYLFALTGTFFDATFSYSVQDTAYRSTFVVEGWKIVRDFCNMFFIFILLYIAFATILNLNGFNTKKMIINVVLIGLLINFSLFATRVIIDASNILARVFYNSDTIQITQLESGNASNIVAKANESGVVPISAALVNKVNPQTLIIQAKKVGDIPDKAGQATNDESGGVTTTTFLVVTILAIAINIVGLIVFLTVGLIFVGRVVGLWLAMILAPLAFFSYTVPAMQNLNMVGWKNWWSETLKMAFLAPIFMFFMYIILQFLDTGLGLLQADANKKFSLDFVISIVVPFAFIMVLLMKAKDIAKDWSGKVGEMVSKAGAVVGGIALGVGAGAVAGIGKATLGRAGAAIADSKNLASAEAKGGIKGWGAKQLRNFGQTAGSGSMDIRGVKIAGKGLSDTGLKNLGTAKTGGFVQFQERKDKERKERADQLKDIMTGDEKSKVTEAQIKLKETMLARKPELDDVDKDIAKTRQEMRDAKDGGNAILAQDRLEELKRLQGKRDSIRKSTKKITSWKTVMGSDGYERLEADTFGDEFKDSEGRVLESIDKAEEIEKKAFRELSKAENASLNTIASSMTTRTSKVINAITSLGKDTSSSINKTAQEIRAGGKKADRDKGDTGK